MKTPSRNFGKPKIHRLLMPKKKPVATPIEAYTHSDKTRPNIPTAELASFAKDDEKKPKKITYAYDPSLSPQLHWAGKQEQDAAGLAVDAVPIYIQEKIAPEALIAALKESDLSPNGSINDPHQGNLFQDFNGISFDKLIEFYQHTQHWTNRMILGDSLLVMTSLAEKERLKGKVQMIYIDPPYGIKFGSNWQNSTRKRDVKDGNADDFTRQPEQIKAFRDTWQLGIHSYLSYLRERLVVARDLLTETGSCFVQIGDENVHLVRNLMDEVFGSENFVVEIIVQKTGSQASDRLPTINDFICVYAKDKSIVKWRNLFQERDERSEIDFTADPLTSSGATVSGSFDIHFKGSKFHSGNNSHWKTHREGISRLVKADRIIAQVSMIRFKKYWQDFVVKPLTNLWIGIGGAADMTYVVQTNPKIIERCLLMTTDVGDLVLDPTCGSGTTAFVAEQWGRRWITTDTSRVALALARTRLMTAKYPYYKPKEKTGSLAEGFIYKQVPHITLKSIANNPEIDTIHAKYEAALEKCRATYNQETKQTLEAWDLPRPKEDGGAGNATLSEYWALWQKRQAEMNESISRQADMETLYDQPEEDKKRIRVSGPFTVESLSPHRVLDAGESLSGIAATGGREDGGFTRMVLENLKKSGVQNTVKGERLMFERLELYSGKYVQAEGEYLEQGKAKRVAICIGPEYGTVSVELVREAAKEAVRFFDLLVVCGFAFEAQVGDDTKEMGRLTVLKAKMNPDLNMSDDLLKKTGSGNLFIVFGEPDVTIWKVDANGEATVSPQEDEWLKVEVRGVDVYDPTTGEVRSNSDRDIACWFIDTNYNGESFFVRQAYFTGAGDPYEKLKRALKAEIAEATWAQLYTTLSIPFKKPTSGKIAVKVINHYGDEVMKVYGV
jgi:adenine-specific DNA-methyltransferase